MNTTILTPRQIEILFREHDDLYAFGHAIEQTVLQSEQVQARMEAYANAKVREALERAETLLRCSADLCKNPDLKGFLNVHADAIHSLIPKE